MTGHPDHADFPLIAETMELFDYFLVELLFFHDTQIKKSIDIVGAELAESFLERASEIEMPQKKIISAGSDHIFFTIGFK